MFKNPWQVAISYSRRLSYVVIPWQAVKGAMGDTGCKCEVYHSLSVWFGIRKTVLGVKWS